MRTTVTLEITLLGRTGKVKRRALVHWPAGKPFTVADMVSSLPGRWLVPAGWSIRITKATLPAAIVAANANKKTVRKPL